MAATLKSYDATVDTDGTVHLIQPVDLRGSVQAVVTILIDETAESDFPTNPELEAIREADTGRRNEDYIDLEDLKAELAQL